MAQVCFSLFRFFCVIKGSVLAYILICCASCKAVSKARSAAAAALVKLTTALQSARAEAEAAMRDAESSPEKDGLKGPTGLVKSRLAFVEVILDESGGSEDELRKLIADVESKKMKQPCMRWESLDTVSAVEACATRSFERLASHEECGKEHIADVVKLCAEQRESVQDLTKSLGAATKDLKTAMLTRAKIQAAAAKKEAGGQAPVATSGANTPASAKITRAPSNAKPIFEFCTSYGSEARSFRQEAELQASVDSSTGDLDFSKPWVWCGAAALLQHVSGEPSVASALSAFKSSWATSAIRASPGRGLQKLKDESTASAAKCILAGSLMRHVLPVPDSAVELTASLTSSIFAVALGTEAAYVEKDALPTLRMATGGSRMVCLCPLTAACKVLEVDMKKGSAFTRLSQALLAATQAKVAALGSELYHFALGPGDVLYTPAGYIVAEAAGIGSGPRNGGKDVRG